MKKISCFVPYAGKEQVEKTIQGFQATGLVENIYLLTTNAALEALEGCQCILVDNPFSSKAIKAVAEAASGEYTLLYTKETTLELGMFALERMITSTDISQSIVNGNRSDNRFLCFDFP